MRVVCFIAAFFLNTSAYAGAAATPPVNERASQEVIIRHLLEKGFEELRAKQLDIAIETFSELLKKEEYHKRGLFGLGTAYIRKKNYESAVGVFEKLIERYPDEYSYKNNLAWLYATAEDIRYRNGKEAVTLAQEALLISPENCHVWSTLSEAYFIAGNYEKGFEAATQALSLAESDGQSVKLVTTYKEQLEKCRQALSAEPIFD